MIMHTCSSFKDFSGRVNDILLFGLIHKVKPYTGKAAKRAEERGLYFHCYAKDENGNIYKLYADYDPCLEITNTTAFLTDNAEV